MAEGSLPVVSIVDNGSGFFESSASKGLERPMRIKDIRASLHGFSIAIPLLEGRVQGYGRAEQTHFVFCEVATDDGQVASGLTGNFLARGVSARPAEQRMPVRRA